MSIYITSDMLYYLAIHVKLSSLFYSTQLVDIFAYEIPFNANLKPKSNEKTKISLTNESVLLYNFHSVLFHQRFFVFVMNTTSRNINKLSTNWNPLNSVTELFLNANWLEREVAELHGIFFSNKKDLRNLMLVYGDTSAPFKKSFPTIGIREIYYDSVTDLLVQAPVTIQF